MKRIVFCVGVIIIAAGLTGGFAALFFLLTSTILAKISEAELSAFAIVLFLSLSVLLSLVLAVLIVFLIGFFVHQADIQYKKRFRSFTVLQSDVTGRRKESAFFPGAFAGDLSGFGYFAPGPGTFPLATKEDSHGTISPGRIAGKGNTILPFPRKNHRRR
jgi:hypothetical protein